MVVGEDHLNSAIHQGGSEKFYSYSRGITKNLQNLKNFQKPPLLVKNDTSLNTVKNVSTASHNLPHFLSEHVSIVKN